MRDSLDKRRVYADHSAATSVLDEVREAILTEMETYGNASSMHRSGREARQKVEEARAQVAELVGAKPSEVIFTSGGSESNNMVIRSFAESMDGRDEVIVSGIEHPSVLNATKHLENSGMKVRYLSVDSDGAIDFAEFERILSKKTALVSIMLANNETGVIQDIRRVAEMAKKAGAMVHTDAVQAIGKISVDVMELGVDYMTMSAHKIGGLKGVGALYVREGARISPLIRGGEQEKGLRAGTYNTLGIIGFGRAAEKARESLEYYAMHSSLLCKVLKEAILTTIPGAIVNSSARKTLPNILNVSFSGAEGESILLALDERGVEVSTGSACASENLEPSHVLMAMGKDAELAHGSIRFSFGLENSEDDVDYIMRVLPEIIAKLRMMSTVGYESHTPLPQILTAKTSSNPSGMRSSEW